MLGWYSYSLFVCILSTYVKWVSESLSLGVCVCVIEKVREGHVCLFERRGRRGWGWGCLHEFWLQKVVLAASVPTDSERENESYEFLCLSHGWKGGTLYKLTNCMNVAHTHVNPRTPLRCVMIDYLIPRRKLTNTFVW